MVPETLPTHLSDRIAVHPEGAAAPAETGGFVLYWMRTAVRGHENPALDVARLAARSLGVPVFVYHALSERYPYASDRHHTFALEGARDVQAELAEQGCGYAFHLERPGHRGPHLATLAARASLVVTELMPVAPFTRWTARVAAATRAPVWQVDTDCVVPMPSVGRAYERAFEFRDATAARRGEEVSRAWPEVAGDGAAFVPDLPFTPIDLASADLAELVARCEIDHTVPPVAGTRGGSEAGYRRWNSFVERALASYHRTRNDPLRDGTSRMSAYLHYGHVSPFRLAREAAAAGGPGAEKYLDELLVWRELAHAYCHHRPDHAAYASLPLWARRGFDERPASGREPELGWETLARARSGDDLWDAAQRDLLRHGELHNNVRMTWGKSLLRWSRSAERALALAIDLNHRYALDGRDPSSYGGLLWCFGAFDRPFPADPTFGTTRARATAEHAERLDVARYAARTRRPEAVAPPRVAMIGAGVSGLLCARTLADHGLEVAVFDKARGPGGRISTRRQAGQEFDHGAQYFTARDPVFRRHVDAWREAGLVHPWQGRLVTLRESVAEPLREETERWVAAPRMSSLARHLADGLDVTTEFRATRLSRDDRRLTIHAEDGRSERGFDCVLISAPGPQAAALAADLAPDLAQRADSVSFAPCWAVMLSFAHRLPLEFDGAFVTDPRLSWVARNSSKAGRPEVDSWVLHATPEWTAAHDGAHADREAIARELVEAFRGATGLDLPEPTHSQAHFWRYALPTTPLSEPCLFDAETGIGMSGDWCGGPRVEGAFRSGAALAGRVLTWASNRKEPRQKALFG